MAAYASTFTTPHHRWEGFGEPYDLSDDPPFGTHARAFHRHQSDSMMFAIHPRISHAVPRSTGFPHGPLSVGPMVFAAPSTVLTGMFSMLIRRNGLNAA